MALQTFTVGQVLTAAQVTALQNNSYNQTVSTKTANYVLEAADVGTRVYMNSAGSTTITVNTGIFAAGDTLFLGNIGAGSCVVTAGTATVSKFSTASLTLSQYQGAYLYFVSTGVAILYSDSAGASASGLTFIKSETIGSAVSSVTVSSAFSATYTNYRIIVTCDSSSTASTLKLTLGATAAGYYSVGFYQAFGTNTVNGFALTNDSYFYGPYGGTNGTAGVIEILKPQLAQRTSFTTIAASPTTTGAAAVWNGFLNNATQYTAFTLTPDTGTITGGEVRVYGYQNS